MSSSWADPLFGKKEFAADSAKLKDSTMQGRSDIQELKVFGDHAYGLSHIQITLARTGEAPRRMAGHTLSIFRKEADQRWRLARDANLVVPGG